MVHGRRRRRQLLIIYIYDDDDCHYNYFAVAIIYNPELYIIAMTDLMIDDSIDGNEHGIDEQ